LKDFKTDVAVIGCGIAGLTAAKRLARRSRKVTLFSKAYGATAMSAGVVDIANPTVIRTPLEPPKELVRKKYAVRSNHPYALILQRETGNDGCGETIPKAVSEFISDMNNVGYPMEGSLDHNMLIINSIGSIRSTCLAPPSVARGDLSKIGNGRIFFLGFNGHADYDPRLCSRNFNATNKVIGIPTEGAKDGSATIDFPGLEERSTLLSIELARQIEREEGIARKIGRMIGEVTKGKGATHVCLPPCMGLSNVEENMRIIDEESGLIPFECVNLTPPSILGYRLQLALDDSASKSNVPMMIPYEAAGFEAEGKTIKRMTLVSGERTFQAEAEKFILATGSFIGGGIVEKDETVREPLLNLPLFDENGLEVGRTFIRTMLSNEVLPFKGHSVFSVGVRTNENMQPISANGELVYSNLFACGNILSGFSHTSSGCRYGVAITTGYVAGEEASKK
jgi:glycerol-3-phosphate dehydrogenase subunit B